MRTPTAAVAAAVVSGALLAAAPAQAVMQPVTQAILDQQRALWESQGIEDYGYAIQKSCFCVLDFVRPHRVTVEAGALTELLFEDTLLPDLTSPPQAFGPFEALFDELQLNLDNDVETLEAMFDPLGFPTMYFRDLGVLIQDDDLTVTVRDFAVLQRPAAEVPLPATVWLLGAAAAALAAGGAAGAARRRR
ncbi:MAG: DUF6174 domain-containing protein [Pseudomonadota bacterium]